MMEPWRGVAAAVLRVMTGCCMLVRVAAAGEAATADTTGWNVDDELSCPTVELTVGKEDGVVIKPAAELTA